MLRASRVAAFTCLTAAVAFAPGAAPGAANAENRPHFAHGVYVPRAGAARLVTPGIPSWTFNWSYAGTNYAADFVGTDPASGLATVVPVYIIPVQITYGTTSYSPLSTLPNGQTVIANTLASPMFARTLAFSQAGVNLGATQYIDAYQRGNLWGVVKSHRTYHVRLGVPHVKPLLTLTVPTSEGQIGSAFGASVIEAGINWFDGAVQTQLTAMKIPANALAIFVTTQTFLTDNPQSGCCIGGYHSFTGVQTYTHFTYIQNAGAFSQDVSALSHEIGEWILDPFTTNGSPCGLLENGDPLENQPNYGTYPYVLGGFTYHLQDLVDLPYFGAPASTTVGGQKTFKGTALRVCQNGA